jgi:hypothetical protein
MNIGESLYAGNWWTYELLRFDFARREVDKLAQTALTLPPLRPGVSLNLEAEKQQIENAMPCRGRQ